PHTTVAQVEPDGGLTIWASEQTAARTKADLCHMFGLCPSTVRMITPYIGGGFGGKAGIMAAPIAILMALKTGKPVQLVYTRDEVFTDGYSRAPAVIYIKDGVKKDGTLVAREIKITLNGGAYSGRVALVTHNAPFGAVGTYRVPNFKLDCYGVYTNEPPGGPFRGFGSELVIWAIESHMDMIAEKLGIDPVEIRRKNILKEGDKDVTGGITYNIGARECLDKVVDFIEWDRKPEAGTGPWKKGKAVALGNKYTMRATTSVVIVKVHEDATIEIRHGGHEIGQGCYTILAQIAAEEFGVSVDRVKLVSTDTAVTPYDFGTLSSRFTFHGGNALRLASLDAKRQIFERVADKLEVSPDDLYTKDGKVYIKGTDEVEMKISDIFRPGGYLPVGGEIIGKATFTGPTSSEDPETGQGERLVAYYCHGAYAVEVAVNVESGEVKVLKVGGCFDMGQPINPKLCEGQIESGMTMGIGHALYEEMVMNDGVILNPSFADYKIPTAECVPSKENIAVALAGVPHREGPYGAKGFSEGVVTPMPAAVANAVYNAVGVRIKDLPITSEKVLKVLKSRTEELIKGNY
ncbi:MAG: molybdopterin cofactor-binding domain-containing protein, partial [Syntrophorhabdales bacterium]